MLKQGILLPGVTNARQLGGYRIGDKVIRQDVLLRTGKLGGATDEALESLENTYHLQYTVDFRMDNEARLQPDPQIKGAKNIHLSVMELEDMGDGDWDDSLLEKYTNPNVSAMERFSLMYDGNFMNESMYSGFLQSDKGKKAYSDFFKLLLEVDEGRAVLWHCTDGKDRTGIAATLLLSALGASRELLIEEYLLTNEFNKQKLDAVREEVKSYSLPPDKLDMVLFLSGGVIREYMENAIDYMEKDYGSVRGYLREELNVGEEEIHSLREKLLTEA